jgi:hypothetical protein
MAFQRDPALVHNDGCALLHGQNIVRCLVNGCPWRGHTTVLRGRAPILGHLAVVHGAEISRPFPLHGTQ